MKILLVGDDQIMRFLYAEVLKENGHEVVELGFRDMAMEVIRDGNFNLIISDTKLPTRVCSREYDDRGGVAVIRAARVAQSSSDAVLVLSGSYSGDLKQESQRLHARAVQPWGLADELMSMKVIASQSQT